MNTFIHSICYSVRTAPSASLPRSHKLRFCPREVASSEPMASPPAPNKGRHPYPIYMPPLRRLRDRSQSSPVFRLIWWGAGDVRHECWSLLHRHAPGIGMLSTRPLEVWALRGWMLTVTGWSHNGCGIVGERWTQRDGVGARVGFSKSFTGKA